MVRDTYGMAEGNWAAMQCRHGNYHLPPGSHAATVDANDALQTGADTTGLLAFFDPFGGGELFPAFFKTADRCICYVATHRVHAARPGAYLAEGSIRTCESPDEAGGAAIGVGHGRFLAARRFAAAARLRETWAFARFPTWTANPRRRTTASPATARYPDLAFSMDRRSWPGGPWPAETCVPTGAADRVRLQTARKWPAAAWPILAPRDSETIRN